MIEQVQMHSQNEKLYSESSIKLNNQGCTQSAKEQSKMIELFNSTNTASDKVLNENNIKTDKTQRKSTIKKVLTGLGIAVGACIAGYLAYKGIQNFKNAKNITNEVANTIPESQLPLLTEEGVHERILSGEFGALKNSSEKDVTKIFSNFASKYNLNFEKGFGEFVVKDLNGNVVREAHQGFFDGLWYDHHQVFNANNNITNRFVLNHKGKLQSTVEYFYDALGKQTMSIGYGGKAGKDIIVFKGSERLQISLGEFISKFGFTPKYYSEIHL